VRRGAALALLLRVAVFAGVATAAAATPPCLRIDPEQDLQAALDAAPSGATLCLAPGRHRGPARIERPLRLEGEPGAWIVSGGTGSTVSVRADGAELRDLGVDGSGGRFDLLDAAVRVEADGVRVEGLRIENALFGILVEKSTGVVLRGNRVRGRPGKVLGMRGDGIRLWEVRDSLVEDNLLEDSRDLVVWYSPGNRFRGNRVLRSRYGTHFMYSHDNVVEGGVFDGNVVGIFVMYSRDLALRGNRILRSGGAAGMGLGAKESGGLEVVSNRLVGNTTGLYLDTSPLDPDRHNRFVGNEVRLGDAAVVFHGRAERNHFVGNRFADNRRLVRLEGRGDARAAEWAGNAYDDYRGYDLDGDGVGDLPYELRSLSGQLVGGHPPLAFFEGTAAMVVVEWLGRLVPLLRPETLLVDPAPRLALELSLP
jgi:nitrous oxidase accessory protein